MNDQANDTGAQNDTTSTPPEFEPIELDFDDLIFEEDDDDIDFRSCA